MEYSQISFDNFFLSEKEQLQIEIQKWISDKEQYGQFIDVAKNKSSISIKVKNRSPVKINPKKDCFWVEFRSIYDNRFAGYNLTHLKNENSRIVVNSFSDVMSLAPIFAAIAEAEVVFGGNDFACCSRFVACSDAKKCIHPNPIFAASCIYRKNLEQGKIFYGKNKTI